jgi:hypothetical protein
VWVGWRSLSWSYSHFLVSFKLETGENYRTFWNGSSGIPICPQTLCLLTCLCHVQTTLPNSLHTHNTQTLWNLVKPKKGVRSKVFGQDREHRE